MYLAKLFINSMVYVPDFEKTNEYKHVHRRIETKIDLNRYI